jgi:hypothetical protein
MRQFTVPPCLPRAERDALIAEIVGYILRPASGALRADVAG